MQVGDLVKAHVGNSDRSGGYGVGQGWWYEYVIVVGDLKTGEGIEYYSDRMNPNCCTIDVMMSGGDVRGFAASRLESV